MDGGAWWATVRGLVKSQTQLSDFTFFHFFELKDTTKVKSRTRKDLLSAASEENIWDLSQINASASYSVGSDSLRPLLLYSPWNSPGQNTGVGSVQSLGCV